MISIEHLKTSRFFQDFTDQQILRIIQISHMETYSALEYIFEEGEEAGKLYILTQGSVSVQQSHKKHQNIIVGTINKKGDLFGWSALVEPKRYRSGIRCLEETRVVSICAEKLEKLFNDDPLMGLKFMKKIAGLIDGRLCNIRDRLISSIS